MENISYILRLAAVSFPKMASWRGSTLVQFHNILKSFRHSIMTVVVLALGISIGLDARAMAPVREGTFHFPEGFLWGVATASHQVEGGNTNNDWAEWERTCHLPHCERSGIAVDHWNRYEEDFAIAQDLNVGIYRMSLEWSRIEPREGEFDHAALDHYVQIIKAARRRGMKIMLTLQHFTLPLWITQGNHRGWLDPQIPALFERFTRYVTPELDGLVDFWITLNEPMVSALTGYVVGASPPGNQDLRIALSAIINMIKSHGLAYHVIHRVNPNAKVSFAHHVRVFDPARNWHIIDRLLSDWVDDFWNKQWVRSVISGNIEFYIPFMLNHREEFPSLRGTMDYLGINYYTRDLVQFNPSRNEKFEIITNTAPGVAHNDLGWEIYPEGFYRVLHSMGRFGYPIYITENGIADSADTRRRSYICSHLSQVARAIRSGVNVRSYIYWSLMDNFEWSLGRQPRFGLVEIDYTSLNRQPRPSSNLFRELAHSNSLQACDQSTELTAESH